LSVQESLLEKNHFGDFTNLVIVWLRPHFQPIFSQGHGRDVGLQSILKKFCEEHSPHVERIEIETEMTLQASAKNSLSGNTH